MYRNTRNKLLSFTHAPQNTESHDLYNISSSGFFTAKGNLVSSIMYPQPTNFRFYQDAAKFLLILGIFGKSFHTDLVPCCFKHMNKLILSVSKAELITFCILRGFDNYSNNFSFFQYCPSCFSFNWHHLQLCDTLQIQCKYKLQCKHQVISGRYLTGQQWMKWYH